MGQQWHFEEDEQKQWHWERTEDTVKSAKPLISDTVKSAKPFPTAAECMLDAVRFAVQRRRAEVEIAGKELLQ